jgi:hypothetical protein
MEKLPRLPIGRQYFAGIRKDAAVYVDKTDNATGAIHTQLSQRRSKTGFWAVSFERIYEWIKRNYSFCS